jgi:hypothetical protein
VAVRGKQLDGEASVSFFVSSGGQGEFTEDLRLTVVPNADAPGRPEGWRLWAGDGLVPGPGCYGLQIDGVGFSEDVVFEAKFCEEEGCYCESPLGPEVPGCEADTR